ncbi:EMP24 GP25L and/or SET domain containing protein [Asbolus verrucosus]|uniref:EMP24 GP25L and/or SET domain containing protein n=1 Tax=Asbolus verrucosus TaxID=1661398 RepID=A0A482VD62_ASBVE|nr:EMP24 GP25L and/or SET domain containing protein [Asbolus verrucosus]
MPLLNTFIFSALLVCMLFNVSNSLYFHIGETERKCFIEEIPDETNVIVNYKVELYDPRSGGFMPSSPGIGMHVEVRDPDDKTLLSRVYSSEGKISFTSHTPGEHVICMYSNSSAWFSGSQLRVHLDIQVGEHAVNYGEVVQKEKLSELQLRVRQLLDQVEQITKEQNYQRSLPHEGIEQFLTPVGFQGLLALIGTNGQGVGTSAISQWVTRTSDLAITDEERAVLDKFIDKLYEDMDSHSGNFLNNEGVALFTLQSACNHSCIPNAEPTYLHNNNKLSLVAVRDIQEGEEICISYLDECNLQRSRHSRRKELMENYLFACNCIKCEEQACDPDVTSEEEEEEDEDMSE